jgi:hypothetical protein
LLIQLIGLFFIFRISLLDLLTELNDIAINLALGLVADEILTTFCASALAFAALGC